jgi:Lon protease-like protein
VTAGFEAPGGQVPASVPGDPLPLFPLRTVLFPGGLLPLKIFEARYMDMVTGCLRSGRPFGVVCLTQGAEAGADNGGTLFESTGTLARIDDVDGQQAGILLLRCTGTQRFRLAGAPARERSGLWTGRAELLPDDEPVAPPPASKPVVDALTEAASRLASEGIEVMTAPLRFDDAGWVANRWCELLPMSLAARQALMALQDPLQRLQVVQGLLQEHKAV